MDAERQKSVVRRVVRAIGAADVLALDYLLTADFVAHGMPPGYGGDATGLKRMATDVKTALGDSQTRIDEFVGSEQDCILARFTTYGIHVGVLFGVPPTSRFIVLARTETYRVSGDRIAELWGDSAMLENLLRPDWLRPD